MPEVLSGLEIGKRFAHFLCGVFFVASPAAAQKAIRDDRKATSNLLGTAELLMTYVENGASFTCDFGDINERLYSSMESALDKLTGLLRSEARGTVPATVLIGRYKSRQLY